MISKINERIESSEFISCAYCNMSCRYCYILKNDKLLDVHNDIIEKIDDDTLIHNLYKIHGDNLKNLVIWGTEPTLTLSHITKKIDYYFKLFPKLSKIKMSSNMLYNIETIYELTTKLNEISYKLDREIELEVQFSLDGPSEITDKNRKENSTNKILSNIMKFISMSSNIKFNKNFIVKTHFKPTMCLENIDFFINQNGIEKYFDFFENILKKIDAIIGNNKNIFMASSYSPTLMVPGLYTSEDGELYAEFVRKMCEKNLQDKKIKKYRYIKSAYIPYLEKLKDLFKNIDMYSYNCAQFTCSAGDGNIGVDQFSNIHICHNSYNLVNDSYLESIYENKSGEAHDVSEFNKVNNDFIKNNYIVHSDDEYNISRIMTVYRGFHDFNEMKISYVKTMVKELALSNQASEEYLYDDNLTTLLSIFLNNMFTCPIENLNATKNINLMSLSIIRLWSNGAFQTILKYYNLFGRLDNELQR